MTSQIAVAQSSSSLSEKIKSELAEFKVLINAVPAFALVFFCLSVFSMNLMANKAINLNLTWLALDCGIVVSWVAMLSMDMLTKHFGPKAATEISIFSILINLVACAFFFVLSIVPGTWGESYVPGSESIICSALDNTFGGTWFIILGSTIAFTVSAFVNNFLNYAVGKTFVKNPDGLLAYLTRSYVSTIIAQFVDNFLFAFLVSQVFFGWTITQCVMCSFFGAGVELLCEVLFSGFGYKTCQRWKREGVGQEYFDYLKKEGKEVC